MSLPFSFVKQNNAEYEVVDKQARADIAGLTVNSTRKYILIGDSFSIPDASYAKLMQDTLGADKVFLYDWSIVQPPGFASQLNFLTILQAIEADITNTNEITDIVCIGGTNDVPHISDVPAGIDAFCAYAKAHFVNATVSIGMLSMGRAYKTNAIAKAYRDGAIRNSCKYIRGLPNLMCDPQYLSGDGVHPTTQGYTFYAPYIVHAIIQGYAEYSFSFTLSLKPASGFSGLQQSATGDLIVYVTDQGVTMRLSFSTITAYINHGTSEPSSGSVMFTLSNFPIVIFEPILYRLFAKVPRTILGSYYGAYGLAMKSVTELAIWGQSNPNVVGNYPSGANQWFELDSSVNAFIDCAY